MAGENDGIPNDLQEAINTLDFSDKCRQAVWGESVTCDKDSDCLTGACNKDPMGGNNKK